MAKYDTIIIGGGHNGLVTAAYLARACRAVFVLERRELLSATAAWSLRTRSPRTIARTASP